MRLCFHRGNDSRYYWCKASEERGCVVIVAVAVGAISVRLLRKGAELPCR
jgi:hypothetical protein